jgi:hypothetical protein
MQELFTAVAEKLDDMRNSVPPPPQAGGKTKVPLKRTDSKDESKCCGGSNKKK